MSTNVKYEYEVVIGYNVFNFPRDNRQSARNTMKEWKESGFDAKIVQRKYELVVERSVR
jgi:hypothetical protein